MLLVKTKIAQSKIAGTGLFADEFIPEGTPVCKFEKGFDIRVDEKYVENLPEPAQSFFKTYAYQDPETMDYFLCIDNARFFNHSATPNIQCATGEDDADVALRDIQAGEELTVDYRTFEADPFYGFDDQK